jgi:hypothetical protein
MPDGDLVVALRTALVALAIGVLVTTDGRPVVYLPDHRLISETRGARPPDAAHAPACLASWGGGSPNRHTQPAGLSPYARTLV